MGVLVGVGVFALSLYVLLRTVRGFQLPWRECEILRGPAVPRQTLRFPVDGEMALYLEGPRFRTWGKRCQYACTDATTGQAVPIAPTLSGSGVRSRRYSRVQHGRLTLPRPGDYVLQVSGLQPSESHEYAVVFMRLFTGQLLRFILACVFLGMVLIGSLVLTILSLAL